MQRKERIELICGFCGNKHYKLQCQIGRNRGHFCSKKCANEFRQNGKLIKCEFCGIEFYRRPGDQMDAIKKYCSKECYSNDRVLNAKKTTYLKSGSVHLHILVAEKALNRKLKSGEIVHHIDLNKKNNFIENLAVLPSQAIHASVHFGNIDIEKYKLINMI
jgi:hypothetical protein